MLCQAFNGVRQLGQCDAGQAIAAKAGAKGSCSCLEGCSNAWHSCSHSACMALGKRRMSTLRKLPTSKLNTLAAISHTALCWVKRSNKVEVVMSYIMHYQ